MALSLRKAAIAVTVGIERLLHDPGATSPAIKTGQVIVGIERRPGMTRIERFRASVEATLKPARYVAANGPEASHLPASRERVISPFVKEIWETVPLPLDDAGMWQAAMTGIVPVQGYNVKQVVTIKQSWSDMAPAERAEVLQSIGQFHRHEDAIYNGYYPTIKGKDVAHHDTDATGMAAFQGGSVIKGNPSADGQHDGTIRGGTEIRGGRREWREKTKHYYEFGPGYWTDIAKIRARQQAERDQKHRVAYEKADALLPRKIGEL